jgi:hypothetical protein
MGHPSRDDSPEVQDTKSRKNPGKKLISVSFAADGKN